MKSFVKIKLKAGALQYAIFTSVIIALLLSALMSVTYLHKRLAIKSTNYLKTIETVNQSFRQLYNYNLVYDIPFKMDSFNNELSIKKKHWGVFDYVCINSKIGKEQFQKKALVGGIIKTQRTALYLQDNKNPLVVVGKTEIKGKVFLPEAGVKRGNMGGETYYGKHLIYGEKRVSKNQLPKLLNRDYLLSIGNNLNSFTKSFIDLKQKNNWVKSFNDTILFYHRNNVINLINEKLTGMIVIKSDTLIRVESTAQLNDVLLLAPYIEIKKGVRGSFQAIASKGIIVEENTVLEYPSAIVLCKETSKSKKELFPIITIKENIKIKGVVMYLLRNRNEKSQFAQIKLANTSKIIGEVYSEANLLLKGRVEGSVYTRSFVAVEFGSIYQNHIYNGLINSSSLSKEYVGLFLKNVKPKVIQWAY